MKLFWKVYACFFLILVSTNAGQFFNPASSIQVYYHTTIIFNNWYVVPYILNILNAIINGLVCLFIFVYAFEVKGLNLPTYFFFLRILSDSTGHAYELKIIESSFFQSKYGGLIGLACLAFLILPSYLVHWRMTFRKKLTTGV